MLGAAAVENTDFFRALAARHRGTEVWPDEEFQEGGWAYFWIMSRSEGAARMLAYVRYKEGQFQKRTYDDAGEDVWVEVA